MAPASKRPQRGRPRDPGTDTAVLDATLRLIARDGYHRMSLQAVADEAGVSKASIHLRWPSKENLAIAAMERERLLDLPLPSGDTRRDLIAQLRWFERTAHRFSALRLTGACLTEEHSTPELMRLLRERAANPRLQNLINVLDAARGRGEIATTADVEVAARLLWGTYWAEYIPDGAPSDLSERAVDLVLGSLGHRAS